MAAHNAVYCEYPLKFELDKSSHIRFEDLKSYQPLKGENLKECDFLFVYNNKFYLLEVTDYSPEETFTDQHVEDLSIEIAKKLVSVLLMMSAAWLKTGWGRNIFDELHPTMQTVLEFEFWIGIELPEKDKKMFGNPIMKKIKQKVFEKTRGYVRLFGLPKFQYADFERLRQHLPFIEDCRLKYGPAAHA